jgi:integrase
MHQNRKGSVVVVSVKGRLRLCWSWPKSIGGTGERYYLTLGLDDDPVNRKQAELKASLIERDRRSGSFDPSLNKYRSQQWREIGLNDLFKSFIKYKKQTITRRTSLEKYEVMVKHLQTFFGDREAAKISSADCAGFRDWLLKRQCPLTASQRLGLLSACFEWAVEAKSVAANPCRAILEAMEVPKTQEAEPFSREEVRKIVAAFEADSDYAYYADLVQWLLGVGCRFGEAAALQWKHLNRNCSEVWIGESVGRDRERKSTKNLKVRRFDLHPRLQQMLLHRRPPSYQLEDLVFPSRRAGGCISDRTFSDSAWPKMLAKATVPYRKLYNTRHTFVSHSLMAGQRWRVKTHWRFARLRVMTRKRCLNIMRGLWASRKPEISIGISACVFGC